MLQKLGLLGKLVIGITLGILFGLWGNIPIMLIYATFNALFGQFLVFSIPLVILGFIIKGISEIGDKAGKTVGLVVAFCYGLTVIGGFLAFFAVMAFSNFVMVDGGELANNYREPVEPLMNIAIAPIMPVMTALIFAFVVGTFMNNLKGENTIKKLSLDFHEIVKQLISKIIIPMLPIHISGIFARIAFEGQAADVLGTFFRVLILILAVHFIFIFTLYFIAGIIYKTNPFRIMKEMIPSYVTALGTQSSAATMPVNLVNVRKIGVHKSVAEFVVPFGATVLLVGSTISIVACAVVVMFMFDMPIEMSTIVPFILVLSMTMVAAPGVPGGAIIAALGALEFELGFSPEMMALMIALYIAQDSFGTAINISSDGAVAIFINKILGHHTLEKVTDSDLLAEEEGTQA